MTFNKMYTAHQHYTKAMLNYTDTEVRIITLKTSRCMVGDWVHI